MPFFFDASNPECSLNISTDFGYIMFMEGKRLLLLVVRGALRVFALGWLKYDD